MSYQRISPDHTDWVREMAAKFSDQWEAARERADGSRDDSFVRLLAFELNQRDPNIGLNGKRGSDVVSADAIAYLNASAPGGVEVIDIIVGSTHTPSWQDATVPPSPANPTGVLGKFIPPVKPEGSAPTPSTPSSPTSITIDIASALAPLQRQVAQLTRDLAALKQQIANAPSQGAGQGSGMPRSFKASMKTAHGKFVAFTDKGKVEPDRDGVGPWETITFDRVD